MNLNNAKGTQDLMPEQKIVIDKLINLLKEIFELYGFSPLETPAIEKFEVLASKYAGGTEILKEVFKLKDQGNRELGLRYDLTVPLARVIGMNPNIKMPFKRYQIEKVWRDGPISSTRLREFYQCDVDVVGIKSMIADAEMLAIVSRFFSMLDFEFTIYVNNRKILTSMLNECNIKKEIQETVLLSLDKLEKIGFKGVENELREKGIKENSIEKIIEFISINGTNEEKIQQLELRLKEKEGLNELKELLEYAKKFSVKNIVFYLPLARGLSYYTGPIFEVKLKESKVKESVVGGGRYDKMISAFLETNKEIPATGLSFGLNRIYEALIEKQKTAKKTVTQLFVIPIGIKAIELIELIEKIRSNGIKVDFDLIGRGPSKNLDYCNSLGIPFALIIGEKELKEKKILLRDMKTGKEEKINLSELNKLKEKIKP